MFGLFISMAVILFASGICICHRMQNSEKINPFTVHAGEGSSVNALLPLLEPYLQGMFGRADQGGVDGESVGDGMVSLDEVVANIDGVDGNHADHLLFDVVDADDDGYVNYPEFKQFVEYYLEQQMAGSDGTGSVDPAAIAQQIQDMIINN